MRTAAAHRVRRRGVSNRAEERDLLIGLAEAKDRLRAIGAGEVDAFVVPDGETGRHVFELDTADRPYRMFVEHMHDGVLTISSKGLILFANQRLSELLSCARDSIVGAPLTRFLPGDAAVGWDELLGADGRGITVEVEMLDADAQAVPVLVRSSPLAVDDQAFICLTVSDLRDDKAHEGEIARPDRAQAERFTELEAAQAELAHHASSDALTGLPNRALLVDRIDQALAVARRSGRFTAVYFIDLDGFKDTNDTQGHDAGNATLQRVAVRLGAVVRPMDSVARIGSDEFALLALEVDDYQHAIDIGTRVVNDLGALPRRGPGGDHLAANVGISISEGGRGTAEILLHEADSAMYQAKSRGGGSVEVYQTALGLRTQQRAGERIALQSALDERRISVHYQPIIDVAGGHVTGFEALARVIDANGAIVPPIDFIPAAEYTGLVVPLGGQVLVRACEALGATAPTKPRPLNVAVNVSARQFESGELPAIVRRTLDDAGLEPTRLHLELTETAVMGLHTSVVKQIGQIRDLGVEVGLDDFGTGYASLTHLRRLPLSFVKIDQSFVQGIVTDPEDEGIVAAVITLASHLGLRSIAEGVETEEQLARLRECGCDEAQGYLLARPQESIEIALMAATRGGRT